MKKTVANVLFLLVVSTVYSTFGQNKFLAVSPRERKNSRIFILSDLQEKTKNTLYRGDKINLYEKSIANRDNILEMMPKLKDRQVIDSLKLSAAERDSIISSQKIMLAKFSDYDELKKRLGSLEIYEFLSKTDSSVFFDSFKRFNINELFVPSCAKIHYSLIEKIHLINIALLKIDRKISDQNISDFAQSNSVSENEARQFLYKSTKNDLLDVDSKMTEIEGSSLYLLTTEQQQFYNKTLTNIYRGIYNKLYPE